MTLLGKQVVATNRLLEDLAKATMIIQEQNINIQELNSERQSLITELENIKNG